LLAILMELGMVIKNKEIPLVLCNAKSKRTGKLCRQPAMKNRKCRLHGGKSTGAKTHKGKLNQKRAVTKHGFYSKEAILERKKTKEYIRKGKKLLLNC